MKKRKVLIVIHQLNYGGVQKSLIPALNSIDYNENDVTLYVRKDRLDILPQVNKNVSRIIINRDKTRYYRKPYSVFLLLIMKIMKLIKRDAITLNNKLKYYVLKKQMDYEFKHNFNEDDRFDVAIAYIQRFPAQFVVDYINADRKIMFYHNSTDEEHKLHERIMSEFNQIVCVSEGAKSVLSELYPMYADKMCCIENYVDANAVREKSLEYRVDTPDDRIKLCSCGRFTEVKGFDLAVYAAKILKDNGIDFVWYFVGDGSERESIEKMISENELDNSIVLTGMQDNPYPYINCCDIYVQPSREEAYGLTIKEALILNKPIITTATVGGKSLIKNDNNGKVAAIDSLSIAENIMSLISEVQLRNRIIENLRSIDYADEYRVFKEKWNKLLEE